MRSVKMTDASKTRVVIGCEQIDGEARHHVYGVFVFGEIAPYPSSPDIRDQTLSLPPPRRTDRPAARSRHPRITDSISMSRRIDLARDTYRFREFVNITCERQTEWRF